MLPTPTSSRVKRERAVYVFNDMLRLAAKEGRVDQVQACLKSGADIDARDRFGWTALAFAAYGGFTVCLQTLLQAGANPNFSERSGNNPALIAALSGQLDTLRILAQAGSNLRAPNVSGVQPIHYAARHKGATACLEFLLGEGCDIEARDHQGATPMIHACSQGRLPQLALLAANGCDLHATTFDGLAAESVARDHGQYDIVEALLALRQRQTLSEAITAAPSPNAHASRI